MLTAMLCAAFIPEVEQADAIFKGLSDHIKASHHKPVNKDRKTFALILLVKLCPSSSAISDSIPGPDLKPQFLTGPW